MSVSVEVHRSAIRFTLSKGVETLKQWVTSFLDSVFIWFTLLGILAIVGFGMGSRIDTTAVVSATFTNLMVFYLIMASLVFAGMLTFVVPALKLLDDYEPPEYETDTLGGIIRESVGNIGGAIYASVIIWISAFVALSATELGFAWLAPWVLIAIPLAEILIISRFEQSPLWFLTIVLLFWVTPIVFLSAVIAYTINRTKPALSSGASIAVEFAKEIQGYNRPSRGSLLDELLLITRHGR